IRRFGHDRLSTHGIGDDLDRVGWRSLFRQLVMAGACDVDAEGYGTLRLNATSWRILRGEEPFRMRKRRPKAKRKGRRARAAAGTTGPAPAELDAFVDDDLFEALRAFRQETADAQGVPPYVVFHDSTLRGVAALRPRTEAELLEVSGVGERKLARYGAEVLAVVAAHLDGADAADDAEAAPPAGD
ncbi:MAG: HRDC domain-containing protein, partial [Planctomycetota bacterium]